MKSVLVTGSAGFIGAHLVRRLLENQEPLRVVGLDNLNGYYDVSLKEARLRWVAAVIPSSPAVIPSSPSVIPSEASVSPGFIGHHYEFVRGDITDAALLDRLFTQHHFDTVVNLAAQVGARNSVENPHAYVENNVTGFLNVLEACRRHGVEHLVFASSSSVYGLNEKAPFAEGDPTDRPVSPYAATKKCDELLAHAYSHTYGLRVTGLRFFTVYGPWGRPDMAPMLFAKAICAGQPIPVFNGGNMLRDFTYIDDIVEGIVRVLRGPAPAATVIQSSPSVIPSSPAVIPSEASVSHAAGDAAPFAIYNIGGSHPVKLTAFIAALEEALGRKAVQRPLPMQAGDVPATYADTTALERDYGFTPRVPLREGLRRFAEWYKSFENSIHKA